MIRDLRVRAAAIVVAAFVMVGCSAGPEPTSAPAPPSPPAPVGDDGYLRVVSGASDSVGSIATSSDARYVFRFKQTSPPSSNFNFEDRDLSFWFRPTAEALHFQVENRRDRPVEIDWGRSQFFRVVGGSDGLAHGTTRWEDRFRSQPNTVIAGLRRYSDYLFPISSLVDPGGDDRQLHRVMFPEYEQALQMVDRQFGVDLVFIIDGRGVTYPFRFQVVSVIKQ